MELSTCPMCGNVKLCGSHISGSVLTSWNVECYCPGRDRHVARQFWRTQEEACEAWERILLALFD